ncbi:diguanylate cyclase (GGDEF) domain-containing protein [Pseudidiomarina planktonica]|uniref:Thiamine pyrimidine synthase n=2 Tax=Pseudidiomarina planktonica TaxID=1323738 RepID=A0A1Y6FXX7_9GAMM|nr:GGDEF domain-containing protein [Pseudidiomarina planktonica]SMQ80489.1 diguanylate cyclase (GGDEF) domain-containing protein [Pseudidiomarina planktonica]
MRYFLITFSLVTMLLWQMPFANAATPVTVQLRWLHQFQFAGYYQAVEQGYFAEAGLDVTLLEGGPDALEPTDKLLRGDIDFAITASGVVMRRLEGKPVVAVAALMQTSPLVWITLKESNITTPQDLVGKRLMMMPPPESAELVTILRKEGLPVDTVQLVPNTYRLDDLIDGKVDAYDGYISNEPYVLNQRGVDYNLINPRDYGVNFYSDVLVTTEDLANSDPELVSAMKEAVERGWDYAFKNVDSTIDLIQANYAPQKSRGHLRYEAEKIRQLVMPELVQLGHMNPGRWQMIAESYQDLNMTRGNASLDGFIFTPPERADYSYIIYSLIGALILLAIVMFIMCRFIYLSRLLTEEIAQRREAEKELQEANKALQTLSITDPLTNLYNRRGFTELVNKAMSRAARERTELAILALDLDHFKKINDEHGHLVGDHVLVRFAELLTTVARPYDTVARVGGEEFSILIERVDIDTATKIAKRIRKDTEALQIMHPDVDEPIRMTVSIGLTLNTTSVIDIWRGADEALYQAKNSGRNRVVVI